MMVARIKLVSVAEMVAVEKAADASGHTYDAMMENAGRGLAEVILDRFGFLDESGILGLVGSGNNGGDTLVALTHLLSEGWPAAAYIVRPRDENDPLVEGVLRAGGKVISAAEDKRGRQLTKLLHEYGLLLDGVLGTGIKLPLRGEVAKILQKVRDFVLENAEAPLVVAVDCPSGVDCDTGAAAPEAIKADLTVTMAAVKQGLVSFPAFELVGDLEVVGIGLDEKMPAWQKLNRFVASHEDVAAMLPPRPLNAHKGTFGTALIVAGSLNYTGAAYLSGRAAYLSGAGLVTLAVPAPLHTALAGSFPEATWLLLPHDMGVINKMAAEVVTENLGRATALLVGPGFGMEETSQGFIESLILDQHSSTEKRSLGFVHSPEDEPEEKNESELPPLVVDADGLKLLANLPEWEERLPALAVLTPHPGEMSVLTGLDVAEIQNKRLETVERFARQWGHVVVLKGAHTLIASPDGRTALVPVATPALARAGTGDVLAGLIVGLRAQGLPAFEAAVAGAWIHAHAGLAAEALLGNSACVVAGDVLEVVVDVMADL
jgi:hydroxyethylthiazole kinase-like uncharacterized protein yjeF